MRSLFGLVLVAGLGLAGTAVYMVQGQMSRTQAQLQAAAEQFVPTIEVAAVNRQLQYGEQIKPEDVVLIRHVRDTVPEGTFLTREEVFSKGEDVLRSVLRQMEPNEPLIAAKVSAPGEGAGLGSRLAAGLRAFAINVDVSSGVSGFINPGDRVDVYWTGTISVGSEAGTEVTRLIMPNVQVIAVDQTADANLGGALVARTVTVQSTPQEIAALAQAQASGRLALSLVGLADSTVASVEQVDQAALLGIEEVAPAPVEVVEAPRVCTRVERRGTERVELPVPCPDAVN